jgi:hypothetical protein
LFASSRIARATRLIYILKTLPRQGSRLGNEGAPSYRTIQFSKSTRRISPQSWSLPGDKKPERRLSKLRRPRFVKNFVANFTRPPSLVKAVF